MDNTRSGTIEPRYDSGWRLAFTRLESEIRATGKDAAVLADASQARSWLLEEGSAA
jgi:hypothetical protein